MYGGHILIANTSTFHVKPFSRRLFIVVTQTTYIHLLGHIDPFTMCITGLNYIYVFQMLLLCNIEDPRISGQQQTCIVNGFSLCGCLYKNVLQAHLKILFECPLSLENIYQYFVMF